MKCFVLALATLLTSQSALADFRIDYQLSGVGCEPEQRVIEIKGTRMRIDMGDNQGNTSAIVDGTEAMIWSLDHDQHIAMQIEIDPDAVDFQTDVGKATAHNMEHKLDELDAAQRDMERQMTEQCKRSGGKDCANQAAMPNIRAMMSPDNMARMQEAMAGMNSTADGSPQIDPAQMQAMIGGTGGAEIDPAMQEMMQSMLGGEDMKEMQRKALAQRAKDEGVDVQTLQAQDAGAAQRMRSSAQRQRGSWRELGPAEVAGIACTRFQLELDDGVLGSECRASWDTLKLEERDAKGSARSLRMAEQFGLAFDPIRQLIGGAATQDKTSGSSIIVEQVCMAQDRETGRATAHISRTPIDEARFEVPPGYRNGR